MDETLHGSFIFTKDSKTTLTGIYFNKELGTPQIETARLIQPDRPQPRIQIPRDFTGTYDSTWFDLWEPTTPVPSELIIIPENEQVVRLTWTVEGVISFWGYGFIRNGSLIGHYSDTRI
jgi:hypothetical protein